MLLRPLTILAGLAVWACTMTSARAVEPVLAFAAASTQPVMDALQPILKARGIDVRIVYGGSSTLARQIENGAGADIFISANVKWMDFLDQHGLIESATRKTIASNRLVMIAAPGVKADAASWPQDLQGGRLAIADPAHVPAGLYGRQALENLGLWADLEPHIAPTKDVTGALMLVARGEAPLGIVYLSDTRRAPSVRIVTVFPTNTHAPIAYQGAILKGRTTATAKAVLDVLSTPEGQDAFTAAGFAGVEQ